MKKLIPSLVVALTLIGNSYADQPYMHEALDHLRAAKAALQVAENNKGGWRVQAIASVNRAIAETERGIRFAR